MGFFSSHAWYLSALNHIITKNISLLNALNEMPAKIPILEKCQLHLAKNSSCGSLLTRKGKSSQLSLFRLKLIVRIQLFLSLWALMASLWELVINDFALSVMSNVVKKKKFTAWRGNRTLKYGLTLLLQVPGALAVILVWLLPLQKLLIFSVSTIS